MSPPDQATGSHHDPLDTVIPQGPTNYKEMQPCDCF